MKEKKSSALSLIALIVSALPLATFVPVLLKITLPVGVSGIWAGLNVLFVLTSFILSVFCVRDKESRRAINIVSMIISTLWLLNMAGIVVLALVLSFM